MDEKQRIPGEKIASIEEYLPGDNTFEDDDSIRATTIGEINLDSSDAIKYLAFQMRSEVDDLFMVLGAEVKGKPNLTVVVSESLVKEKGLNAGAIIRDLAKEIKGGGGGQPFYATAGGKDVSGLDNALKKAEAFI